MDVEHTDSGIDGKDGIHSTKEIIDKNLTSFFVACNVPFKVVEDPYFLDLINELCRSSYRYKPPCRQTLASTCLDNIHEDIIAEKQTCLKGTPSVLMVDGWRNKSANNKYVVCTICNINAPQYFLTFTDASIQREDGVSLSKIIDAAIKIAKEKFETGVFGIVTDNDSKIVSASRLAKSYDNKKLWQLTCSSHSANLLIKSFVNENIIQKIRLVVTEFREPKLDSILQRLGGCKLQNFPDTRFCYIRNTCERILKNLVYM